MENKINKQKSVLGDLSMRLLSYAQLKKKTIARIGDFTTALGLTETQERKLLSRLAKTGLIVRLTRGIYLLPEQLPPGGKYNPGIGVILSILFESIKGDYQICGPAAFNHYGYDEQIPNLTHIYNNRLSGERKIGSLYFQFIKTGDNRLGSIEKISTGNGSEIVYSSNLRTLMDAVYDWSRFNSVPKAYKWIKHEVMKHPEVGTKLAEVTIQYGNQSTLRRIGYLLDSLEAQQSKLELMRDSFSNTKSIIPYIPGIDTNGPINKKWGIFENG